MTTDHYAAITASILAALEAGVKPWARPWQTKGGAYTLDAGLPHNAASGRNYRGINVAMLWGQAHAQGYTTHQWLSFRQARALGGSVRKGEKATMVYFFKMLLRTEERNGEQSTRAIPLIRAYPVFNVAQCDGLKIPARVLPKPTESAGALGVVGPVVDRLALLGGCTFRGDAAFYAPGTDAIFLPPVESFASRDGFLATALHECGHATGAKSRLDRLQMRARFGDQEYAFEELVAELCSAMAQAALGIRADVENHASYLDNWHKVLKRDKHAFARACSLAQAAADVLLGANQEQEQEQEELAQAA